MCDLYPQTFFSGQITESDLTITVIYVNYSLIQQLPVGFTSSVIQDRFYFSSQKLAPWETRGGTA